MELQLAENSNLEDLAPRPLDNHHIVVHISMFTGTNCDRDALEREIGRKVDYAVIAESDAKVRASICHNRGFEEQMLGRSGRQKMAPDTWSLMMYVVCNCRAEMPLPLHVQKSNKNNLHARNARKHQITMP